MCWCRVMESQVAMEGSSHDKGERHGARMAAGQMTRTGGILHMFGRTPQGFLISERKRR